MDDAVPPNITKIRVSRLAANGPSWTQVVGGANPINHSATQSGDYPSIASIVAFLRRVVGGGACTRGNCSGNNETHASRLCTDVRIRGWSRSAALSPINQSVDGYSDFTSLTSVGGVPDVAWSETDGTNSEIRVARLNGTGTAGKIGQATDPASPINRLG